MATYFFKTEEKDYMIFEEEISFHNYFANKARPVKLETEVYPRMFMYNSDIENWEELSGEEVKEAEKGLTAYYSEQLAYMDARRAAANRLCYTVLNAHKT